MISLIIVGISCLAWAFWLREEAGYSGFDVSDMVTHSRLVGKFWEAWSQGQLGLETWDATASFGQPIFRLYQNLPHFMAALLGKIFGIAQPSHAVHFVLVLAWSFQGLAFYFAAKRLRFSPLSSLAVALTAPFIFSGIPFGHELRSYIFFGTGLFTQVVAVPFFVLSIPLAAEIGGFSETASSPWRLGVEAGLWAAATYLCQPFYGYMALFILVAAGLMGIYRRAGFVFRAWLASGAAFFILSAYQLLALFQDLSLAHRTPWYNPRRWDGMGLGAITEALAKGAALDFGRFPTITALAALGAISALRPKADRIERFFLLIAAAGIFFCAGRTTFGGLFDLLPFSENLPLERFIGLVQIACLFLAALGIELIRRWIGEAAAAVGLGAAVVTLVIAISPLVALNDQALSKQRTAEAAWDSEILKSLEPALAKGRFWSYSFLDKTPPVVGRVPLYNVASAQGHAQLSAPEQNLTYPSDILYLFEPYRKDHYQIFDISAVILKRAKEAPSFLKAKYLTQSLTTYEAPSSGMWDVVGVSAVTITENEKQWLDLTQKWLWKENDERASYPALVPQKVAKAWPSAVPVTSPKPERRWGKVLQVKAQSAVFEASHPGAYGIWRTAFHPRWKIVVNGKSVAPVWMGPGFIGFPLNVGENKVEVQFPDDKWRAFLFLLAMTGFFAIPLAALWPGAERLAPARSMERTPSPL